MCQRIRPLFIVLVLSSGLLHSAPQARADGGLLRLRQKVAGYEITVFTSPTPVRVGTVDVSVLVQKAATGEFVPDAQVTVCVKIPGTEHTLKYAATSDAATNKLFKAAVFNLPEAGSRDVEVVVEGPHEAAQVTFAIEANEQLPRWRELWPWFAWPAVVVALFGAHRLLARYASQRSAIHYYPTTR
jgi:hypothetical protein